MPINLQRDMASRLRRLKAHQRDCQHTTPHALRRPPVPREPASDEPRDGGCPRKAQWRVVCFELDANGARRSKEPEDLRLCTRHKHRRTDKDEPLARFYQVVKAEPLPPDQK